MYSSIFSHGRPLQQYYIQFPTKRPLNEKNVSLFLPSAYPLGAFYRTLKTSALVKNLLIAATGIVIVVFNYGTDLYHSALAVAVTYLLNAVFATSSLLVPLSFSYHMGYLLVGEFVVTFLSVPN